MNAITSILDQVSHRPYPLPDGKWTYYQEWSNIFLAHWKVPEWQVSPLLPAGLRPDLFEGVSWVSLVACLVKNLRPRMLPPLPYLSAFYAVNLRTYVTYNGKPGIYFLTMEADKAISALIAKTVTGLPFRKSMILHDSGFYQSWDQKRDYYMYARYNPGLVITAKNDVDQWLTGRFCMFRERKGGITFNDFHHEPWLLRHAEIEDQEYNFNLGRLSINRDADLSHYSDGFPVLMWGKK